MKLLEAIRGGGYFGSVATSFSCDLPFYEQQVLHPLRTAGCTNNLLLVDAGAYVDGIAAQASLASSAGRLYSLIPVDLGAAFHPKVFLQLGADRGRALVGSANVSLPGWTRNREAVVELSFVGLDHPLRPLVAGLYSYAQSFCDRSSRTIAFQLEELERLAPWLLADRSDGPVQLPDGRVVGIVCNDASRGSTASRFAHLVRPDRVKRLVALAPFWDEDAAAFAHLAESLAAEKRVVLLQPRTSTFNRTLAVSHQPRAYEVSPDRYLHAKVYVAEGEMHDHLFVGSANCSVRALGIAGTPPRNAETCVYERLPPSTALRAFGLDAVVESGGLISPDTLASATNKEPGDGIRPKLPGMFELEGDRIRWRPAPALSPTEMEVELLDARLRPLGRWGATADAAAFVVRPADGVARKGWAARGVLPDGSHTAPGIIHSLDEIRRAAPAGEGAAVRSVVERLRLGTGDVLELLGPFQRLLFQPRAQGAGRMRHEASEPSPPQNEPTGTSQQLTYAEFLEGRGRQPLPRRSPGSVERSDLATLLEFLSDRFRRDEASDTSDISDEVDVTDDEEEAELNRGDGEPVPPTLPPPPPIDLDRARSLFARVFSDYRRWVCALRRSDEPLTPDDVAQLGLLLRLSACLMGKRLDDGNGALSPVLPETASGCVDLLSFVTDVLGLFFVRGRLEAPAARIVVSKEPRLATELPVTWSLAAWAIGRAIATAERDGLVGTTRQLETIAFALYSGTGLGRDFFDDAEVLAEVVRTEASAGACISVEQLTLLHERFKSLSQIRPPDDWTPSKSGPNSLSVGDRVWAHRAGLRYVRAARPKVVELDSPGADGHGEDALRLGIGFVVRLP